mgnify:CR=1 FL=1
MLTIEKLVELMHKYGYGSTSEFPFIYQNGEDLGICYSYIDDNYGYLERIKFFKDEIVLEDFLKKLQWLSINGKLTNSRMILDNYQIRNPKNMFLRNEKIMVKGEMFNIEDFNRKEAEKEKMDELTRTLAEAGELILIYDDLKNRQFDYFKNVRSLSNELRNKYFELQQEVDKYNNTQVERTIKLLPDVVSNDGVNTMMETSAKDRYNQFKVKEPPLDEAKSFVKEIWELNRGLELNSKYYEAMVEENNIRNEIRVVDSKIVHMKELNKAKGSKKENLIKTFKEINRKCEATSINLSTDFLTIKLESIEKKYSYFDYLNKKKLADYLKEAVINTNYGGLAVKYAADNPIPLTSFIKKPANEVAASLFKQYKECLNLDEQTVLVLYNSKYRRLFDFILEIKDFESKPISEIVATLSKARGFSKVKSECYDYVKNCINDSKNKDVKTKLFSKVDFSSFESFIESMVNLLKMLKVINNKLKLQGDINMYFFVGDKTQINVGKFMFVTSDLNSIKVKVNNSNNMIAIVNLRNNVPVLYSPFCLDFGNVYDKKNNQMMIKEVSTFELLIDKDDVNIYIDPNINLIVDYQAVRQMVGDYTIVNDLKLVNKINYCQMSIFNNVKEGNR